jgi:phosphoribosylformylglycinamidine cyclo-ligase
MATDRLLHLLRAPTGSPAAATTRAAGWGRPRTQRVDVWQVAAGIRRASVSCSSTSSGGQGGLTYKDAGVDIDAGAELVRRIARMAPGIGGFGGLFPYSNAPASLLSLLSYLYFFKKTSLL